MTEAEVDRVARAIAKAMKRGRSRPWMLARAALEASNAYRGTDQIMSERLRKTIAKNNRYRKSNSKGWDTRRKQAAARAEAERQQGKVA